MKYLYIHNYIPIQILFMDFILLEDYLIYKKLIIEAIL